MGMGQAGALGEGGVWEQQETSATTWRRFHDCAHRTGHSAGVLSIHCYVRTSGRQGQCCIVVQRLAVSHFTITSQLNK